MLATQEPQHVTATPIEAVVLGPRASAGEPAHLDTQSRPRAERERGAARHPRQRWVVLEEVGSTCGAVVQSSTAQQHPRAAACRYVCTGSREAGTQLELLLMTGGRGDCCLAGVVGERTAHFGDSQTHCLGKVGPLASEASARV